MFRTVRLVFSIVILAALAVMSTPGSSAAVTLSPGDPAPRFALKDIDGNVVSLDQFKGKTVVLAFWSTWCSRCEEELTFLRDTFGGRRDVAVVLVNQDSEKSFPAERVRAYREKLGITFPVLIDEGLSLWEHYGISALPTSVVIGRNGLVTLVEPNFYWASPEKLLDATSRM